MNQGPPVLQIDWHSIGTFVEHVWNAMNTWLALRPSFGGRKLSLGNFGQEWSTFKECVKSTQSGWP